MSDLRRGGCHCGAVRFEIEFPGGIVDLYRCNCSLCRMKGVVMTSVPMERLTLVAGADALVTYRWNTRVARHYFCRRCGIYTHHQRRSKPQDYAVNAACLDDFSVPDQADVNIVDGAANSVVVPRRA